MPRLWTDTVETHRHEVRDAIIQAAGQLVHRNGLLSVTMSQIAEATGIGRATLYKYFPDVESVLAAWHERHVARHLDELTAIAAGPGDPTGRLRSVLGTYARICRERRRHGGDEVAAALHRGAPAARLRQRLTALIGGLIAEAAALDAARNDVPATELASFCVHALDAAGDSTSQAALSRLVDLVSAAVLDH